MNDQYIDVFFVNQILLSNPEQGKQVIVDSQNSNYPIYDVHIEYFILHTLIYLNMRCFAIVMVHMGYGISTIKSLPITRYRPHWSLRQILPRAGMLEDQVDDI